jgi:hypothetical protein
VVEFPGTEQAMQASAAMTKLTNISSTTAEAAAAHIEGLAEVCGLTGVGG